MRIALAASSCILCSRGSRMQLYVNNELQSAWRTSTAAISCRQRAASHVANTCRNCKLTKARRRMGVRAADHTFVMSELPDPSPQVTVSDGPYSLPQPTLGGRLPATVRPTGQGAGETAACSCSLHRPAAAAVQVQAVLTAKFNRPQAQRQLFELMFEHFDVPSVRPDG